MTHNVQHTWYPPVQAIYDRYEPVGKDEPGASEVVVEPDMTPEEVAAMVLQKVSEARNNTQS